MMMLGQLFKKLGGLLWRSTTPRTRHIGGQNQHFRDVWCVPQRPQETRHNVTSNRRAVLCSRAPHHEKLNPICVRGRLERNARKVGGGREGYRLSSGEREKRASERGSGAIYAPKARGVNPFLSARVPWVNSRRGTKRPPSRPKKGREGTMREKPHHGCGAHTWSITKARQLSKRPEPPRWTLERIYAPQKHAERASEQCLKQPQ